MKKRILATVLATVLTCSMVLSGCGNESGTTDQPATSGTDDAAAATDTAPADTGGEGDAAAPAASHDEALTLEMYNVAANYQGEQTGWYGKILKDKFNITINIIAPQVSGDGEGLYATRTASGNLGDMVLLDNGLLQECVESGLIADMSAEIKNYPNLMKYWEQIEKFNKGIGDGTGIYGIPTEMNTNGPTAYMAETVSSMPRIPWDYYTELGKPELNNLDDLISVLADMQKAHPENADGKKAYGMTLWKDWDGGGEQVTIENVNQLTKWYGQEVNGSVLIGSDNTITPLTDKNGAYYKMLKFFYNANQAGIVDPDSATQEWGDACDKMQTKRTYLVWNNWMLGFTNNPERGEAGENYMGMPIKDMQVFQTSDYYYGSGRVFGIGSGVSDDVKARILEYYDWLASPEGCTTQHIGTEGIIYTVGDDGKYTLTEDGYNRFNSEIMIPEDQGGGNWTDGNNQVNQWIVASVETNPVTGETYGSDLWASYLEKNNTKTAKEWRELYDGKQNEVEYLKDTGMMNIVPSLNLSLAVDTSDISMARGSCRSIICDASWQAIFASSEAEFDSIWDDMVTKIEGNGWADLVAYDTAKYQPVIDGRKAAQ